MLKNEINHKYSPCSFYLSSFYELSGALKKNYTPPFPQTAMTTCSLGIYKYFLAVTIYEHSPRSGA